MSADLLTTARWHCLHSDMPWGREVNAAVVEALGERLGYAAPDAPDAPATPLPDLDQAPKIGLCLGHGRPLDQGNVGAGGISEEEYNLPILRAVGARLRKLGIEVDEVTHYPPAGYGEAMQWLARRALADSWTGAVEFHFNAANQLARGHEVLHWQASERGVTLARRILAALDAAFPRQPSRGLKPRGHRDRGALFLSLLHCPSVIVEPFFGDQATDWELFSSEAGQARLVDAYVRGIAAWVEDLAAQAAQKSMGANPSGPQTRKEGA